jgi:predicted NBD/HSP70 family sugar kinase
MSSAEPNDPTARRYPRPVASVADPSRPDGELDGGRVDRGAFLRGLADVLDLFRHPGGDGRALSRPELAARTGLSRATVKGRVDALLDARLITPVAGGTSTGGRPAERFRFNAGLGALLVADVGATAFRAALCDLAGEIIEQSAQRMDVARGPEVVLGAVSGRFAELLDRAGRARGEVLGIGLSLPGPVDFASGRVVSPPIMTGWDGYDIRGWFAADYDAPVLVDKDANAMVAGEHHEHFGSVDDMMMLKVGTGVGSGLISGGRIHRGADGAAGDIGHIQLTETSDPPECRCGNLGCVEAYAGGWALIRDLSATQPDVRTVDDVVSVIRSGDITAQRLVRRAGRILGHALADAVNLFNPRIVLIGGQLVHADELLLAGIREVVYRRSLPLATRNLSIVHSALDQRAGIVGLASLLTEQIFSPAALARLV